MNENQNFDNRLRIFLALIIGLVCFGLTTSYVIWTQLSKPGLVKPSFNCETQFFSAVKDLEKYGIVSIGYGNWKSDKGAGEWWNLKFKRDEEPKLEFTIDHTKVGLCDAINEAYHKVQLNVASKLQ